MTDLTRGGGHRLTDAEKKSIRWLGQWYWDSQYGVMMVESLLYTVVPPNREPRGLVSIYERATPAELDRALHLEDVWRRWQRLRRAQKRCRARDGAYRQEFV
jgi:hypothetical protein